MQGPVDGSIVPAAAAGSLPFLFSDSMMVLRNLRQRYGKQIWKRYGFVDAFNPMTGWVDHEVVGIDVGISMVMAENARSEFVWRTFMRNPEVQTAMDKGRLWPFAHAGNSLLDAGLSGHALVIRGIPAPDFWNPTLVLHGVAAKARAGSKPHIETPCDKFSQSLALWR